MNMNRYAQIMDASGILGINEIIGKAGVKMDYDAWASEGFCPKQGCVGEIVGDAYSHNGPLWILKCTPSVFVPVAQWAVREISEAVYQQRKSYSLALGKDPNGVQCKKEKELAIQAEMQASLYNLLSGFGRF